MFRKCPLDVSLFYCVDKVNCSRCSLASDFTETQNETLISMQTQSSVNNVTNLKYTGEKKQRGLKQ